MSNLINKILIFSVIASIFLSSQATPATSDEEFVFSDSILALSELSVTAIKQGRNLRSEAIAATTINAATIERENIYAIKDISDMTPNFYIPDYGSRITSSIYVRGIGARIDQPVVGLNIDNIPVLNKDNYDLDLTDIERIEMLRGAQSTLYGRNTMGGVINLYTLSPLNYSGGRIMAEYSSGNSYKIGASYYTKVNDKLGLAAVASYNSTDGFFINEYNNQKCDWERSGNARIKLDWKPSQDWSIENTLLSSLSKQGGYPYMSVATEQISYNDSCYYNRFAISDGLTIKGNFDKFTASSISSIQYMDANMTLDQDFLPLPYFTLTQATKELGVTQDLILKDNNNDNYQWLAGLFGFYKNNDTHAPVTFKDTGITQLIEANRNNANPNYPIEWDTRTLPLDSKFTTNTYGVAAYHQSTYNYGNWSASIGLRLDYEHSRLYYDCYCNSSFTTYKLNQEGEREFFRQTPVEIIEKDNLSQDFLELLPRISLTYKLPNMHNSNIYATVAKGYKAGGFNTQMFSDVLQQHIMELMGLSMLYDVEDIITYKPEKSWTYELGTHTEFFDGRLKADATLFLVNCTDQQLTVFPDGSTTGRIMTNAGKTRSYGGELAITANPIDNLMFNASYGYTNAKFTEYDNGQEDYAGNYIPYAPQNTLYLAAIYTLEFNDAFFRSLTFNINSNGVGSIYWNESNSLKQQFYMLLGSSIELEHPNFSLNLWGKNLANYDYKTFYFESMGNEFVQCGNPMQLGATLKIKI